MNIKVSIAAVVMFVALAGCGNRMSPTSSGSEFVGYTSNDVVTPEQFSVWKNNENGLTRKRNFGKTEFRLSYLPASWMAVKSLGSKATTADIEKESGYYSELHYFNLRLKLNGAQKEPLRHNEGEMNYTQRVSYYSFGIQRDLSLVTNQGDTLPCGITHFERTYSNTNYCDILMGFSKKQLDECSPGWKRITVLYTDRVFNNGAMQFVFTRSQLTNIPKLKMP